MAPKPFEFGTHIAEPSIRDHLSATVRGTKSILRRGRHIVFREMQRQEGVIFPSSERDLVKSPAVNALSEQGDYSIPNAYSGQERFYFNDSLILAYKAWPNKDEDHKEMGIDDFERIIFYVPHDIHPSKYDKIIEIKLEESGKIISPIEFIRRYGIVSAHLYRLDNGTEEYWKIVVKEEPLLIKKVYSFAKRRVVTLMFDEVFKNNAELMANLDRITVTLQEAAFENNNVPEVVPKMSINRKEIEYFPQVFSEIGQARQESMGAFNKYRIVKAFGEHHLSEYLSDNEGGSVTRFFTFGFDGRTPGTFSQDPPGKGIKSHGFRLMGWHDDPGNPEYRHALLERRRDNFISIKGWSQDNLGAIWMAHEGEDIIELYRWYFGMFGLGEMKLVKWDKEEQKDFGSTQYMCHPLRIWVRTRPIITEAYKTIENLAINIYAGNKTT